MCDFNVRHSFKFYTVKTSRVTLINQEMALYSLFSQQCPPPAQFHPQRLEKNVGHSNCKKKDVLLINAVYYL